MGASVKGEVVPWDPGVWHSLPGGGQRSSQAPTLKPPLLCAEPLTALSLEALFLLEQQAGKGWDRAEWIRTEAPSPPQAKSKHNHAYLVCIKLAHHCSSSKERI